MVPRRTLTRNLLVTAVCILAAAALLFTSCNPTEIINPGTVTINITGADAYEGCDFHYEIDTFPGEKALDDYKTFTDSEVITGGEVHVTIEDPDAPGTDYLFQANNVISFFGYIDVDDDGENYGGIDYEANDLIDKLVCGNINGDMVLTGVYPTDFHLSESGNASITLYGNTGNMLWRYHQQENDLGSATAGVAKDFTCRIQNDGTALLELTGSSPNYVTVTGDTEVFSITTQPDPGTGIIPGTYVTFVMTVNTATPGDYQAQISIPFDDNDTDDTDAASPYKANFTITVN